MTTAAYKISQSDIDAAYKIQGYLKDNKSRWVTATEIKKETNIGKSQFFKAMFWLKAVELVQFRLDIRDTRKTLYKFRAFAQSP